MQRASATFRLTERTRRAPPGDRCNQTWRGIGPSAKFQPMDRLFDILIPVALGAVLITLAFGLFALYRGGEFGRSYSNKLMRLRVVLQFVAIVILVAAFWWRSRG